MSRHIHRPDCECCGAPFSESGCTRGYKCGCDQFPHKPCELCRYCGKHCRCNTPMRAALHNARLEYQQALQVIREANPNKVNKR